MLQLKIKHVCQQNVKRFPQICSVRLGQCAAEATLSVFLGHKVLNNVIWQKKTLLLPLQRIAVVLV